MIILMKFMLLLGDGTNLNTTVLTIVDESSTESTISLVKDLQLQVAQT